MARRFKQEAFQYNRARDGDRRTAVIPLVGWRNPADLFMVSPSQAPSMGTVLTVWMMISDSAFEKVSLQRLPVIARRRDRRVCRFHSCIAGGHFRSSGDPSCSGPHYRCKSQAR